jgi:hypothetical protein
MDKPNFIALSRKLESQLLEMLEPHSNRSFIDYAIDFNIGSMNVRLPNPANHKSSCPEPNPGVELHMLNHDPVRLLILAAMHNPAFQQIASAESGWVASSSLIPLFPQHP